MTSAMMQMMSSSYHTGLQFLVMRRTSWNILIQFMLFRILSLNQNNFGNRNLNDLCFASALDYVFWIGFLHLFIGGLLKKKIWFLSTNVWNNSWEKYVIFRLFLWYSCMVTYSVWQQGCSILLKHILKPKKYWNTDDYYNCHSTLVRVTAP